MKRYLKLVLLIFTVLISVRAEAQTVEIPDRRNEPFLRRPSDNSQPLLPVESRKTDGTVGGAMKLLQDYVLMRRKILGEQDRDTGFEGMLDRFVNEFNAGVQGKGDHQLLVQHGTRMITFEQMTNSPVRAEETQDVVQTALAALTGHNGARAK